MRSSGERVGPRPRLIWRIGLTRPDFDHRSSNHLTWRPHPAAGTFFKPNGRRPSFDARWRRAAHVVRRREPESDWDLGTSTASNWLFVHADASTPRASDGPAHCNRTRCTLLRRGGDCSKAHRPVVTWTQGRAVRIRSAAQGGHRACCPVGVDEVPMAGVNLTIVGMSDPAPAAGFLLAPSGVRPEIHTGRPRQRTGPTSSHRGRGRRFETKVEGINQKNDLIYQLPEFLRRFTFER